MIFTCIGHAKFLIELENGLRIVTDPYDESCGYPVTPVKADVVLVSHGHHDHNAVETIPGVPRVIDQAGTYDLDGGGQIIAVEAFHDDVQGAKRGKTLLFSIQAEGLNAVHLGDLGHLPEENHCSALGQVDVLMLPVGGFFTIDAAQALQTAELLHAGILLPMHYKTQANESWPIAPVEDFLSQCGKPWEVLNLLRVTKGDLMCQVPVAVLAPQSLRNSEDVEEVLNDGEEGR